MSAQDPSRAPSESPEQPLAFLWRGRWTILAATILGALLGVLYARHRGTIWRVESVLFVERSDPFVLGQEARWGQTLPRNHANTQAELLRSSPVLLAALQHPGITGSVVFDDSPNELSWLKRHLGVRVGDEDDLITVSLESPHKAAACEVVNAVVDAYRELVAQEDPQAAVLDRLTDELDQYEAMVASEQSALLGFHEANPGIQLQEERSAVAAARFQQLNAALTDAELEAQQASAVWRLASELLATPDVLLQLPILGTDRMRISAPREWTDARQLGELRGLMLQLEAQRTAREASRLQELQGLRLQLLTRLSPEHPEIVELDKTIELLEQRPGGDPTAQVERAVRQLEELQADQEGRFAEAYVAALERRWQNALQWRDELRRQVADQEERILSVDPKLAEYRAHEMRLERTRRVADLLFERVSELDILEAVEDVSPLQEDVLVFESATPEGAIVASSQRALAAVAAFLGFLVGAALAWMRSLGDQTLRTIDDVEPLLPVLATIPRLEVSPEGPLVTWDDDPEYCEAMRSLRVAVCLGESARSRTIQVTSPESGDGKSLVAAGLAIAMAQAGQRTLLVDADFRRPNVGRLFGVAPTGGLARLLEEGLDDGVAAPTEVPGLEVLPAGQLPTRRAEVLSSPRLGMLLRQLEERYDAIVIDSPPLLRISDGRIIAAAVDETLLVLCAGKSTRRLADAATGAVASLGRDVLGAVLNRVHHASMLGTSVRAYGPLVITDDEPQSPAS